MALKATKWQIKSVLKTSSWQGDCCIFGDGTTWAPANRSDAGHSAGPGLRVKISPESGRITLNLQPCFKGFPWQFSRIAVDLRQCWETSGSTRLWIRDGPHLQTATNILLPGTHSDTKEVCQSLLEVLLMRMERMGREDGCFCYIGSSRPVLLIHTAELAAMVVQHFCPSHDYFFNDYHNSQMVWFKTKSVSLCHWRREAVPGVRNQTKAVLQMSQNEKIPWAEKANDHLLSKFC